MRNLNQLTLLEAQKELKSGNISSLELTEACLNQIEMYNPKINAFLSVFKDEALLAAVSADKEMLNKGEDIFDLKPLLGIPYACKDNFNTKGHETTAASNILKGYIPPYESTVTKKLKLAGAILLGKTNMDAFAHGASTETSDFGSTYNPWNVDYVPGGSSGGSGAAVAANMCIFSIGSETAGSIRGPAAWCGVTGLKPTYGRVSRYGVIAMASSTDSPGPMTKNAQDAAIVLSVIAGKDPFDATSSPTDVINYLDMCNLDSLEGITVGKAKSYFVDELSTDVKNSTNEFIDKLAELGAHIVEVDLLDPKYAIGVYTIVQRSEVSSNLGRFSGVRYGHTRDKFGFEAKKRIMLGSYALSAGYYDKYYAKAQKVRTMIINNFTEVFEKVDFVVGPVMPTVALKIGESENTPLFGELADKLVEPSAVAGLTAVSLPCGFEKIADGTQLPIGVQVIGPQFSEGKLLGLSSLYQSNTDFHKNFPEMEA